MSSVALVANRRCGYSDRIDASRIQLPPGGARRCLQAAVWRLVPRREARESAAKSDLGFTRHFVGARLVDRRVVAHVVGSDDAILQHPCFDLFPADIGQHVTVDLDARAEHLPRTFNHYGALRGVIDDIAIFEGKLVLLHDGADALAPTTGGFEVGDYFRGGRGPGGCNCIHEGMLARSGAGAID